MAPAQRLNATVPRPIRPQQGPPPPKRVTGPKPASTAPSQPNSSSPSPPPPSPMRQVGPVGIPRPPVQTSVKSVGSSQTSAVSAQLPIKTVPERRTPPRPNAAAAPPSPKGASTKSAEATSAVSETRPTTSVKATNSEDAAQAALSELAKRASQVRGTPSDGVAPVVVPRKKPSSGSLAAKAMEAKKEEIAKKIASGSVAAPSKSMSVQAPSRLTSQSASTTSAPSKFPDAPSLRERYATEGSTPKPYEGEAVAAAASKTNSPGAAQKAAAVKQANKVQSEVTGAMKEVGDALGKAVHIHVHAPVHIHIGAKL